MLHAVNSVQQTYSRSRLKYNQNKTNDSKRVQKKDVSFGNLLTSVQGFLSPEAISSFLVGCAVVFFFMRRK